MNAGGDPNDVVTTLSLYASDDQATEESAKSDEAAPADDAGAAAEGEGEGEGAE